MTDERLAEIEKDIEDRSECYGVSSGTVLDLIQALRAEMSSTSALIATNDCLSKQLEAERAKVAELQELTKTNSLIENIRKHYQMSIYTVNDQWCIQLFDLDICANDEVDCVYETASLSLRHALTLTNDFVYENIDSE